MRYFAIAFLLSTLAIVALRVEEKVAERQPSSTPTAIIADQKVELIHSEVFRFDRRMKAVMNEKDVLTDIHYSGYLFVDWKEVGKEKRKGIFSFHVKDAPELPVFAEVELSSDYFLLEMKVSTVTNEDEENAVLFLKDLVSVYAFRTFEDTTGKYEGSLKILNKTEKETILLKKKNKYESSSFAQLKFNKSIHEYRVGEQLEEVSGFEDTQMGKEIKTSGVYQLKRLVVGDVMKLGIKKPKLDLKTPLMIATLKTNPSEIIEKNAPWEELEKKLSLLPTLTGKARLGLFHELVKEMKKNPKNLDAFMAWMKAGLDEPQKVSMGIGILAAVGNEKAQHELVQLYEQRSKESPETAHLILNSFASKTMKPSAEVIGMLNSILDHRKENPDLAANAAYALGAVGDVKKINELAEQASDKNEKIIYIDAMGNSGSSESLPFLLESVKSSDPQIREKAIFAMRFVNDERVKPIFEQSMNDASMSVRYAVVKAVPFQSNPRDYEVLLMNCANQSGEQQLKSLCSDALVSF
jgi:hypothetical protein